MKSEAFNGRASASLSRRAGGRSARRGIASILAMMFLVLFSTLAIGFYAATTTQGQISGNQKRLAVAQLAADSGTQYMRYQLGSMQLPSVNPATLLADVATALGTQMNGTTNMGSNTVQVTGSGATAAIYIPAPPASNQWISIDPANNMQFRAMIQQTGQFLVVTVDGAGPNSSVARGILMKYNFAPQAGAVLNFGVASQGTISTGGSSVIQGLTDPSKGSVLSADTISATPVTIAGKSVSGDISIVNPLGLVTVGVGRSVGGTTDPLLMQQHIHKGVGTPVFPTADVSVYTQYATTPYDGSGTCNNCYIPPNTNPKFTSGATINGVMWVKAPNNVIFRGTSVITGVIVNDQPASKFDAVNNVLNFSGAVTAAPISNTSYAGENQLTGTFIIAPSFNVSFTGNFGTVDGTICAGQIGMTGSASGTIQGTVIGMTDNPLTINGSGSITIASTGTSNYPTGLSFGNYYAPLPGTYVEVTPW